MLVYEVLASLFLNWIQILGTYIFGDFPLITTMLAETEILIVRIRTHWTSHGREGRRLKRGLDLMMP